ncbi:MAG: NYN domain-containing protein [Lentisphaeria bacterium]|nr:NYN domain-containing protein [Lentisphaeria bacterium]
MAQKAQQLALLIDYDNLMGFNGKLDVDLNRNYSHQDVVAYLETHYGPVVYCKAYGDWSGPRTRHTITDLSKAGAEMQFIPRATGTAFRIPGYAAVCMGLDALDEIARNAELGGVVFGTNDLALLPFVSRIRAMGKSVYILGPEAASAAALTRVADEFIATADNNAAGAVRAKAPNSTDKSQVLYAIKTILVNGEMPIEQLEAKVLDVMPDFSPADFSCANFEEFLRNIANTTVKITKTDDATTVGLGNCHNASAYSDEELASFDLAQYMQATRWHITDGDIRDKVLHNIFIIFSEKGREMTNEDLRNTVDPDHVVDDRPWQGTIWSLIFGACLWENPKTSNQPQSRRLLSLFRTVTSEDDFLVRYYTSLFKKAYEDRPSLTPQECAELMHPENVEGALPLFERVFQNLRNPVILKTPATK